MRILNYGKKMLRKLFRVRQQKRFKAKQDTYITILIQNNLDITERKKVRLLDISLDGAAFSYDIATDKIPDDGIINLSASGKSEIEYEDISNIYFTSVNETPLYWTYDNFRRRGIKFTRLNEFADEYLKNFIQENVVVEI
jgi:c-di-GMP-binding flagellar brake protein YcgR